MNINAKVDRYCAKCHKIKNLYDFEKIPYALKFAGVCTQCKKK